MAGCVFKKASIRAIICGHLARVYSSYKAVNSALYLSISFTYCAY